MTAVWKIFHLFVCYIDMNVWFQWWRDGSSKGLLIICNGSSQYWLAYLRDSTYLDIVVAVICSVTVRIPGISLTGL